MLEVISGSEYITRIDKLSPDNPNRAIQCTIYRFWARAVSTIVIYDKSNTVQSNRLAICAECLFSISIARLKIADIKSMEDIKELKITKAINLKDEV